MPSLIITEKPRVAEKIANALADGPVERKALHGVSYYIISRGGKEFFVAPAVGHLYTLRQSVKGSGYPVFDIEWAPSSEVDKDAAFTKKYVSQLSSLAKKSDSFIVACDYDIEGSLIGFNVLRFACNAKEGKRMKFSALTKEDLVEAFESAGQLDYPNIWAGEARHILDWLWGINLSRALMHAIRSAGVFKVLSIGRVQGPALELLAVREREILAFKPVPYWEITAVVKDTRFIHEKERFFKREEADRALENSGKNGSVLKISSRRFAVFPNPPFDLTSLQITAYSAFGFSPAQTLQLAQSLYEASLISYPRTASQKLPEKLNLKKIISDLGKQEKYSPIAAKLASQNRFKPLEGKKTDPAHPAIYPTGLAPKAVGDQEVKLYDLIVKRFLSCFAEDAERENQKVLLQLGGEKFVASGTRTVKEGWFEFYSPYVKLEEATLPPFSEGEKVQAEGVSMQEKQTQPPRRFTPASVIEVLEKKNLGTKSTRAGIIETLTNRGYIQDKNIRVTPFGLSIASALEKNSPQILDEEMTRSLQEKMDLIQEGKATSEGVVAEGKVFLEKLLADFKPREKEIGSELLVALKETEVKQSVLGACPACKNGQLRSLRSRAGKSFVGCSNYPECKSAYPLPQLAKVVPIGRACQFCGTPIIRVFRKGKRPFEMCLLPTCESKKDWGTKKQVKPVAKPEKP